MLCLCFICQTVPCLVYLKVVPNWFSFGNMGLLVHIRLQTCQPFQQILLKWIFSPLQLVALQVIEVSNPSLSTRVLYFSHGSNMSHFMVVPQYTPMQRQVRDVKQYNLSCLVLDALLNG